MNDTPEAALSALSGMVWSIGGIDEAALAKYSAELPVSNVRKLPDYGYEIKVISGEPPAENARPATPTLEDAFLYYFKERQGGKS